MGGTLAMLILAAALEIGGDAAIRHGLVRSAWHSLALGAVSLVVYGLVVNANRLVDFGRLMGLYIAVFFVGRGGHVPVARGRLQHQDR